MAIPRSELSLGFSTLEKLRARESVGSSKTNNYVGMSWEGGSCLFSRLLFSVGLTPLTQKYGGIEIWDEDLLSRGEPS